MLEGALQREVTKRFNGMLEQRVSEENDLRVGGLENVVSIALVKLRSTYLTAMFELKWLWGWS